MRGFVRPSVGRFVVIESEIGKTRISAPAHPSATGTGRVSSLIFHGVVVEWKRKKDKKSANFGDTTGNSPQLDAATFGHGNPICLISLTLTFLTQFFRKKTFTILVLND